VYANEAFSRSDASLNRAALSGTWQDAI